MGIIKGFFILLGWFYDIIMLPFVLLWKLGKILAFVAFVIVISLIAWGFVFG